MKNLFLVSGSVLWLGVLCVSPVSAQSGVCTSDSDCVLIENACGGPIPIDKAHKAESEKIQAKNKEKIGKPGSNMNCGELLKGRDAKVLWQGVVAKCDEPSWLPADMHHGKKYCQAKRTS